MPCGRVLWWTCLFLIGRITYVLKCTCGATGLFFREGSSGWTAPVQIKPFFGTLTLLKDKEVRPVVRLYLLTPVFPLGSAPAPVLLLSPIADDRPTFTRGKALVKSKQRSVRKQGIRRETTMNRWIGRNGPIWKGPDLRLKDHDLSANHLPTNGSQSSPQWLALPPPPTLSLTVSKSWRTLPTRLHLSHWPCDTATVSPRCSHLITSNSIFSNQS